MSDVEVRISGPLFDGRADAALRELERDVLREVSNQVLADVHDVLNRSIRNPTPYYETQLNIRNEPNAAVVNDRGIVYGPWLEGVSSRNQTTRFKGYSAFRRARQAIPGKVPGLIAATVRRAVERMGG